MPARQAVINSIQSARRRRVCAAPVPIELLLFIINDDDIFKRISLYLFPYDIFMDSRFDRPLTRVSMRIKKKITSSTRWENSSFAFPSVRIPIVQTIVSFILFIIIIIIYSV